MKYLLIYLVVMNLIGFLAMGIDKARAMKDRWRIPEKALFIISAIGGSVGTLVGMWFFHHKTRHWYFVIGMPLILLIHIALCYVFLHH